MDEEQRNGSSTGGMDDTGGTPADRTDPHERLANTAAQEQKTSLEGPPAESTLDELVEGLERAQQQPRYGREGS